VIRRVLLFAALACTLAGCIPGLIGPSDQLSLERAGSGAYLATAKIGPTLLINSSAEISNWEPRVACTVLDQVKGKTTSLKCPVTKTPFTVAFSTSSPTPNVQVVDGLRFITPIVIASP
jgi:hypothetical protein